jgi:16S rRNA processing protein RimM
MVVMGRVAAPHGVRGWLKINTFTETPETLAGFPIWWLAGATGWQEHRVAEAEVRGNTLLAKFAGVGDREQAQRLSGHQVAVPREALPEPDAGTFYWADLVGLRVVNLQGEQLGTIDGLVETGANDVIVVKGERERLIPCLGHVLLEVDVEAGEVRVDWGLDY